MFSKSGRPRGPSQTWGASPPHNLQGVPGPSGAGQTSMQCKAKEEKQRKAIKAVQSKEIQGKHKKQKHCGQSGAAIFSRSQMFDRGDVWLGRASAVFRGSRGPGFWGQSQGPKAYKFTGFGAIHGPRAYKFIGFGAIHGPKAKVWGHPWPKSL